MFCFFFKQKTAYEMRISDWSSDVCSSDLNDLDYGYAAASAVFHRSEPTNAIATPSRSYWAQPPSSSATSRSDAQPGTIGIAHLLGVERGEIGRASCRERVCQYV